MDHFDFEPVTNSSSSSSSPLVVDPDEALRASRNALRKMDVQLWLLFAVAILVTILRTYVRVKAVGFRGLRADDMLVWAAVVSLPRPTRTGLSKH
jgi:hypothetical protein